MSIQRRRLLQAVGAGTALGLAGCLGGDGDTTGTGTAVSGGVGDGELVLATTTSTVDTGLLDALHPVFERQFGVTMKTVPKGTGASIRTARDGDADAVLVHARNAEDAFMRDGFGLNRRDVMFNDFVVVGPPDDPAGISGTGSATAAFTAVADEGATFVSRGDDSGTNKKELVIWDAAGVDPGGSWYQEVGKGMGDTLVQADRSGAYTLADRGTYRSAKDELDLVVHVEGPLKGGPTVLKNPYGVMAVNPERHGDVNYAVATAYVGFLTSPQAQSRIANYTTNGSQLFFPNALAPEPNFAQYVPQGYSAAGADRLGDHDKRYLNWVGRQVPDDH